MPNQYCRWVLITAIALPAMGCAARDWRPPGPTQADSPPPQLKFSDYLQANRIGRWVYERTEIQPGPNRPAGSYARRTTVNRMQEGALENQKLLPLDQYFQTSTPSAARTPRAATTYPLGKERWGIFFEVAEPMDPFPPELEGNNPISTSTTIRYFDQSGKLADTGTLTRQAQIEGFETVECPAGTFDNCMRIRVDLLIRFHWGPQVDLKAYAWLSPKVGEVRRVQRMSGWYWIFWFGSAHEYRLASYEPIDAASNPAALPTAWARGAMVLDRVIPHPLIAGLVVDFADASNAMTKPAE